MTERIFTKEEIKSLTKTTTLFLLREQDSANHSAFEKAIRSAWKFTEIKVIPYSQLSEYMEGNYSYFIMQGYNTVVQSDRTGTSNLPHLYLTLVAPHRKTGRDGTPEIEFINFCRIELFTDYYAMQTLSSNNSSAIDLMYQNQMFSGLLRNWNPAMIGFYLADVQWNLEGYKREKLAESVKNKQKLSGLENEILYVPDYILLKYNKWTGSELEKHSVYTLFEYSPMTIKIVSTEELFAGLEDKTITYVLDYVKSCAYKHVRIYSTKDGKIYQKFRTGSYNLKPKDIKKIFK